MKTNISCEKQVITELNFVIMLITNLNFFNRCLSFLKNNYIKLPFSSLKNNANDLFACIRSATLNFG